MSAEKLARPKRVRRLERRLRAGYSQATLVFWSARSGGLGLALLGALSAACGGDDKNTQPPVDAQGGTANVGGSADAGASACDGACAGLGGASGAGGMATAEIVISEISLSQALKVPLMAGGVALPMSAIPIVSGKAGVLRVFVEPGSQYRRRELVATLEVGPGVALISNQKFIAAASRDEDTRTSFNFPLEGSELDAGTSFSVTLTEESGEQIAGARFPETGTAPMAGQSSNGNLRVMIVPLVASGFVPDTGPTLVDRFRRRLRSMYPIPDAEITVHAPVTLSYAIPPDGDEWDRALDDLYELRAADAPASNVFYYGLLTPAPTYDDYCFTDCTIGLAVLNEPDEVQYRGGIGLGMFSDGSGSEDAADTLAHEIGHALGRDHSPCGVPPGDRGPFPYADGSIGVWGYDMDVRRPLEPSQYFDLMGYCVPAWISDFTYNALFSRISAVNGPAQALLVGEPTRYRVIVVSAGGGLRWGRETLRSGLPKGAPEPVTLIDEAGEGVSQMTGYFYRFDHRPGGFVLVAAEALGGAPEASAVRLDGRGSALLRL